MPPDGIRLLVVSALAAVALLAQEVKPAEPPEEDESLTEKEYAFNPVQAQAELKVGNFYFRKGNHRAAAARFREAAKWNENFAEAYLRLGEACQRLKDEACYRPAYERFLALAPEDKEAARIRRLLTSKR